MIIIWLIAIVFNNLSPIQTACTYGVVVLSLLRILLIHASVCSTCRIPGCYELETDRSRE